MFLEIGCVVRITPRNPNYAGQKVIGQIVQIEPAYNPNDKTIYRILVRNDSAGYGYGVYDNTYNRESHEIEMLTDDEAMIWKLEYL